MSDPVASNSADSDGGGAVATGGDVVAEGAQAGCGTNAPGCDGHGGCGGNHGCGSHGATHVPELDARVIDPVIRQSAIFGVLVGLPPAAAVTVVTDQDPGPIAELLHERLPGEYEVATERDEQDTFRVTFARV